MTLDAGGSDREVLTQSPYTWNFAVPTGVTTLPVRVTAVDDAGQAASDEITLLVAEPPKVTVNITSPVAGTIAVEPRAENSRVSTVSGSSQNIQEGDTVLVRAEVSGTGSITVVFKIGGTAQAPITQPPYSMDYFVPFTPLGVTPAPLEIVATATDGAGNTATDSVTVTVDRKTTNVNVTITSPQSDASVKAGDTITISAETDDNSQIAFFTFSVDGVETIIMNAPFTQTYTVPLKASGAAAVSNIPPHAFVGKATLDGVKAPDDTVVIAWIAGSGATILTIKITATANSGETGSSTLLLPVSNSINAGQATVNDGEYVLNASQPAGQNFNGKTVTFTIGGKDAAQTATWQQGSVELLNLTAN